MKKILLVTLALLITLTFAGCGQRQQTVSAEPEPTSTSAGNTYDFGGYSWRVLFDVGGDAIIVVSEEIIETRRFDDDSNDWASSEIRQYLNGEFLNNFSAEEQFRIIEMPLKDVGTTDKVFLLSVEELGVFFDSPEDCYAFYDAEKYSNPDDPLFLGSDVERWWWLRTPGANGVGVSVAGSSGPLSPEQNNVTYRYYGVRPAMIISRASSQDTPSVSSPNPSPSGPQLPSGAIDWTEARQHVGENVTIYGAVARSTYASNANGKPTYIDIGAAYPDANRVSIVIWGEDRGNFSGAPENAYLGKTVCVTGKVYIYDNACYIKVQSPSRIQIIQ